MTVLIGAITNTGRLNNRASAIQSHTLEEGAYNTLVVCVGMCQGSYDVSTITYAGLSLTKATEKGRNDYMGEIWNLNNAPSGSNNVVVTYTGTVTSTVINIFGLIGANTLNAVNTATDDSGTASVTVTTTESYCIVIDCCGSGTTTWTVGDSQTQISQTDLSNATLRMSYEYKTAAGGCAMTWSGTSNDWSSCGAAFSSNMVGKGVILV